MHFKEALLGEYDQEMAVTRRVLENVPDDKFDFQPHPRGWTMQKLATHVADIPGWTKPSIDSDGIELAGFVPPPPCTNRKELIERFDKFAAEGHAALAAADDEAFGKPWSLTMNGNALFTLTRGVTLRSFVMNHLIHHRGQLSVYLRITDCKVPSIYGPSGDEQNF